jgi:hypothetical protein
MTIRPVHSLVVVVGEPLFIVRQSSESLLERLKFTRLVRNR